MRYYVKDNQVVRLPLNISRDTEMESLFRLSEDCDDWDHIDCASNLSDDEVIHTHKESQRYLALQSVCSTNQ